MIMSEVEIPSVLFVSLNFPIFLTYKGKLPSMKLYAMADTWAPIWSNGYTLLLNLQIHKHPSQLR